MTKPFRPVVASDADHRRACATIVVLLQSAFLNIGSESSSQRGPYGAATLQVQHITWLEPSIARFHFPGRNGVEWNCVVRLDAGIAKSIRYFMSGKRPHDRVFPVRPVHVNAYLRQLNSSSEHGFFTAKDFRTSAANRYLRSYLWCLDSARLEFGLKPVELKRIFRGLSPKRQDKATQRLVAISRSTAAVVVKEMQPRIGIPAYLLPSKKTHASAIVDDGPVGVLPFVATLLNIKSMALCKYQLDPRIILDLCHQWGWGKRAPEVLLGKRW
jgi:hypothetical protein